MQRQVELGVVRQCAENVAAECDSSSCRAAHQSSRRQWLKVCAASAIAVPAGDLTLRMAYGDGDTVVLPHHVPRAKRVIFLFMHGGPSQVDLFDYKPKLQDSDGQTLPFEPAKNISAKPQLMASPWRFSRCGESGLWFSELMPELARHADKLCMIHSMHSRGQSHGQAVCMLHTGSDSLVRPSVGAWVSYGLGSANRNLPTFVSIAPSSGHGGPRNYGSAFLPAVHQATTIGRSGKLGKGEIPYLVNASRDSNEQRRQMELLQQINRDHLRRVAADDRIQSAAEVIDLAFRMQNAAPAVLRLTDESPFVHRLYGIGDSATDNFGRQCLLARRLIEAGVRYVQVCTANIWDQHSNLRTGHTNNSRAVDRPIAGLLTDLESRGLLDDTLIVWGGEFGRTPIAQGKDGRDHNPQGFTVWLAGGGVRGGIRHGNTDEFGYYAIENRVHMHDLHATILYALGLDHERLTYRYAGRDFRLTDVYGRVVNDIFS